LPHFLQSGYDKLFIGKTISIGKVKKRHFKNQVPLALANILILELISEFYVVGCIELLINNGNGFYGAVFSCVTLLMFIWPALLKIMMAQEPLSFILSPQISCVLVELNSLNNILLFILKI
jgi:hypothetical protein